MQEIFTFRKAKVVFPHVWFINCERLRAAQGAFYLFFRLLAHSDVVLYCFIVRLMSPMALETLRFMWLATWGKKLWLQSW